MIFSRPATADDFKGFDVEYDGRRMSDRVKQRIEAGYLHDGVTLFSEETGVSLMRLVPSCRTYQSYILAKRDFEAGKPVFVSY